jgi:hypothetical protein
MMSAMARPHRLAVLASVALRAVAAAAAGQERPAVVSTAATLTVLSASVERVGTGADRPGAVGSGADLAVGDRVVTGPAGRALITFLDGSTVTVEPASDVTVRQAQMDGRDASRVGLLVTVGTVWARVAGWLGGRTTLTLESNAYSATAHDGLIGAQQQVSGPFVCWTRAGDLDVTGPAGPVARLRPGQKATLTPGGPVQTEGFAVNRSTLEIATSGPVLPLVTMPDGTRLAGFVPPGVEINQVFGSLTATAAGGARSVDVPAGVAGPFVVTLAAVGDGPFTLTVVGRHQGAVTYRYERAGAAHHGQGLRAEVIQIMDAPAGGTLDPRTARAGSAGMTELRPDVTRAVPVPLSALELAAPRR